MRQIGFPAIPRVDDRRKREIRVRRLTKAQLARLTGGGGKGLIGPMGWHCPPKSDGTVCSGSFSDSCGKASC